MKELSGKFVVVQHCAVFGRLETPVRWFHVSDPEPHAQHDRSVRVSFIEPRKRLRAFYRMTPGDLRYLTINDEGGVVLYDSRTDVPTDMEKWEATRRKFEANPAITITRASL
jgi:hypothetical protein